MKTSWNLINSHQILIKFSSILGFSLLMATSAGIEESFFALFVGAASASESRVACNFSKDAKPPQRRNFLCKFSAITVFPQDFRVFFFVDFHWFSSCQSGTNSLSCRLSSGLPAVLPSGVLTFSSASISWVITTDLIWSSSTCHDHHNHHDFISGNISCVFAKLLTELASFRLPSFPLPRRRHCCHPPAAPRQGGAGLCCAATWWHPSTMPTA